MKKGLFSLFLTFLKIGAFTFGGGYAMIPLIEREVAEDKKWITKDEMLDMVAVAESTPGPIAVNAATFVGYRVGGFFGALLATLGVILPSVLIIIGVSFVLDAVRDSKIVADMFRGIRAGVLALVIKALISMYKQSKKSVFAYVVMAAAFVCVAFAGIGAIPVLLFCGAAGAVYSFILTGRAKK